MSRLTDTDSKYIRFIVEYYRQTSFYPSYEEIANGLYLSKATVFAHMQKLEAAGVLIRKAPASPIYRIINIDFMLKARNNNEFLQSKVSEE